ncbi:unnamed protein product [Adineta steineri]|uniref:Transmembrane protein n=1 Tax=Adineta steineri TaxID=433720 RepID=A0A814TDI7_9BILA|nr:unnamed protein product [Adineta steineri]CAF1156772.1 unnamed protein product [Adineta steineri]CAF1159578.1 unnamed protein product [Adineta steineri]CAF3752409.1 unnamed protein product [Adineta steineri]CAF3815781.1 unnamed protein product [Adineta steineri]
MEHDQFSMWEATPNKNNLEPIDNSQHSHNCDSSAHTSLSRSSNWYAASFIYGLLLGGLVAGVAFAVILTLYIMN